MRRLRHWPIEHAVAARLLHQQWGRGDVSATAAVKQLSKRGVADAWNLWLDVCEESCPVEPILASYGQKKTRNPDGSERRSRQLPLSPRGPAR